MKKEIPLRRRNSLFGFKLRHVLRSFILGAVLAVALVALVACGGGGGGGKKGGGVGSDPVTNSGGGGGVGDSGGSAGGGGGSDSFDDSATADTAVSTDVTISIVISDPAITGLTSPASAVVTVIVNVFDGGSEIGTGTSLTLISGVWSATIADLPLSIPLDFDAHGFNITPTEIFAGSNTNVSLTGSDTIGINMAPLDDGVALQFPRIVAIINPTAAVNQTVNISADLEGNASETLTVVFTSDPPGAIVTPNQSPTTTGAGNVTVNTDYVANSTIGTYVQSISVTNPQGNSVENDFNMVVAVSSTDVNVNLSPVLGSVIGNRANGTGDITWTATVTDDVDDPATDLTYLWSFVQTAGDFLTASFTGTGGINNANPGVMVDYDETVVGTVQLQMTDLDGGVTTATFPLNAGQFPDSVVTNP